MTQAVATELSESYHTFEQKLDLNTSITSFIPSTSFSSVHILLFWKHKTNLFENKKAIHSSHKYHFPELHMSALTDMERIEKEKVNF